MTDAGYDSSHDTLLHIQDVQRHIADVVKNIILRAGRHDFSKLLPPEKNEFDHAGQGFLKYAYGSPEYHEHLKTIKKALNHHYKNNDHHPEAHESRPARIPEDICALHDLVHTGTTDELMLRMPEIKALIEQVYAWYASPMRAMSLMSLVELLSDWRAASGRDGNTLHHSLAVGDARYAIGPQLFCVLEETARELGWLEPL